MAMARPFGSIFDMVLSEWDKTSQPLKERASVLPLGQYEDGSVGLAWPQLLAAPAEGLANFGTYGYGEEAVPYNTRMAFDAAGGAMTGAGPAQIAAAATAKRLPGAVTIETQAARPNIFYRGVKDAREPVERLTDYTFWASDNPVVSNQYADGRMPAVYPATAEFENPMIVDARGANWNSIRPTWYSREIYDTDTLAHLARARGHDGLIIKNVRDGADDDYESITPVSSVIAALRRGTVKSATTGDLLYSNAPTSASIPLGLESQSQDTDPALMQYLAAIGVMDGPQAQPPTHQPMPSPSDLDLRLQDLIDQGVDPMNIFRTPAPRPENPNAPRPWLDRRG